MSSSTHKRTNCCARNNKAHARSVNLILAAPFESSQTLRSADKISKRAKHPLFLLRRRAKSQPLLVSQRGCKIKYLPCPYNISSLLPFSSTLLNALYLHVNKKITKKISRFSKTGHFGTKKTRDNNHVKCTIGLC